jgi:hypothetical protein
MIVEGAMETPDGVWRVEAIRRGRERWFRIIRREPIDRESIIDWLTIASVERILDEAGVSLAELVDVAA